MKLNRLIFFVIFSFCFVSCEEKRISDSVPEYKFLREFSYKIKPETGLILWSFGVNNDLPKGYERRNKISNFSVSYALIKNKNHNFSVEEARNLSVYVVEKLLEEIKSDQEINQKLEIFPFVADRIELSLYFVDENKVELGQGISEVYFGNGQIKYQRYEIEEYKGRYPAKGKHINVYTETYAEALEIVKKNGGPKKLVN